MVNKSRAERYYDVSALVDAPEFYELSRSMGILTQGTWDHRVRTGQERIDDFVDAFPPEDPVRFSRGSLIHSKEGGFAPGTPALRLERFLSPDWRTGSLNELLSRYGLKLRNASREEHPHFEPSSLRESAKSRNAKLRAMHGTVDVEPTDMDAAKAAHLEFEEKRRAAQEIREARNKMRAELEESD